jgi:ABC-2 type transport system permease protein
MPFAPLEDFSMIATFPRTNLPGQIASFARLEFRRALRNRRYLILGMGIPVVFYLLNSGALQENRTAQSIDGTPWPAYFMVSMASYGAIVAGLLSAQVIATERSQGWVRLLRVTPLPPAAYVVTKLLTSLVITLPAVLLVVVAGTLFGGVAVPPLSLVEVALVLVLGSIPFAALGVLMGYVFDANAAQGAAMITNLSLAVLGGLWAPASALPAALRTIGDVLPSSHLANLGRAAVSGRTPDVTDVAVLVAYVLVIGGLVVWRFRSDGRARA